MRRSRVRPLSFTGIRAMLPVLIRALAEYDPAWIKGGMKPDEVEEQKARFNDDPDCRILLAQCDAAKYGHTLLAGPAEEDRCRTMIFFENSYSRGHARSDRGSHPPPRPDWRVRALYRSLRFRTGPPHRARSTNEGRPLSDPFSKTSRSQSRAISKVYIVRVLC